MTCPLHYCTSPEDASSAAAEAVAENGSVQLEYARTVGTVAVAGVVAVQHIAGDKLQPAVVPEHDPDAATAVAEH